MTYQPVSTIFTVAALAALAALSAWCYWTPTILARRLRHPDVAAVAALNFLLGWTALGWIAAFVWACSAGRSAAPAPRLVPRRAQWL